MENDEKVKIQKNEKLNQHNNNTTHSYNNSIEFIDEIEKIYINNKIFKEKKLYELNNYKNNSSKDAIKVINYIPKASLSSLIFKKGIIITCMTIKLNNIYIGTNKGEIRVYSWKTEKKLNYLINSEVVRETKRDVICMDASSDNKVLVVGHLNGFILLWDIKSAECKKLIKDEFSSQIVAIKFTLVENSFYEFLASDLKGSVKRLGLNEGFFFNSVNSNYVIDYTQPIFIIEVLQLTKEQKKLIEKYNNDDDIEEPLIVAFGALDFVFIVQLEPEIKRLYNFKKPTYIKGSFVPDISFGIGRLPAPVYYSQDLTDDEMKKIKKEDLKLNIKSSVYINKNYQFILVSWGKVIFMYMISFDLKDFLSINLIGNYINNEPILRMGFLSNNIIYILDLYKKFKVLNTSFMNPGEIKTDSEGNLLNNNLSKPELCTEFSLDYEILFQTYIPDTNNTFKSTYNNSVIGQQKNIFAVCKNYIYFGCLLNWAQCINELFKNSEWLEAFKLGIDIYHGENKVLDGIPINVKERKENVKRILKGLILQLILNTLNIKDIFYNKKTSEEILSKCINISIELCLDVNELNFLLKEILPILEEKGYFNFFIEKIKPFILEGKITNELLGQNITSKILKYYIDLNDYVTLSQIIIKLDINKFDINDIKNVCIEKNIFLPLIYIFFKSKEDDLFSLIKKLYDLFIKANSIPKEKYNEYKSDIINNKIENKKINEIQLDKQYIGQKLFWCINLCLKGRKYPSEEKMEEKRYVYLGKKIYLWLLKDEVLNELLNFDSRTFFFLFGKFFRKEKLYNTIKIIDFEENKKLFEGILLKENNIKDFDIKYIIEIILNKIKDIKNILVDDDFNEFILIINSNKQILSINYIINSINYFINYNNRKNEREKKEDYFDYHSNISNDNDKIELYSIQINKVLENYKNRIDKKELNKILLLADKNKFPLVCIKILQILNENIKCLDVYLDKKNNIKNKKEKIFEFIKEFMSKAGKEKQIYKKEIIERGQNLAELSMDKFLEMNLKWLNDEQLLVLEKLGVNNDIKLEYIEHYINYFKENNMNEENNTKGNNFYKMLIIHIETLCKIRKKKNIINFLKSDSSYLNDEVLKVCLKNNVFDAAIHIYIYQGNFTKALNLCKKEITNSIDNLLQIYSDQNLSKKKQLIKEHDEIISKCCYICEKESEQLPKKERKKIWFDILEFLYQKIELINTKHKNQKINFEEITTKISEDINVFILKMYPYTDMKSLLKEIYKKSQMSEFSGFSNILHRFVKEQIIFKNIFNKIKSLLDYSINDNYKEKNKYNIKGINYIMEECDFCHEEFVNNDNILLLKCGHIVHKNNKCCIIINNKFNNCRKCYDKKESQSIGSIEDKKFELNLIDEYIQKEKKINQSNDKNNIKEKFKKLDLINDKYNKKYSTLDVDIEDIKSNKNKYKKTK